MTWKLTAAAGVLLVAAVLAARLWQDPETGTASWDAARTSGFAGYLLLWASVASGLALYFRARPGGAPLTAIVELHRVTSALGLSFVAAHVAALLVDPAVHFAPIDAVVPFTSAYRPLQTGLGTAATWLLVAILASTAAAGRLPYATWRRLHWLAFPCWLLALAHGLTAGSDSAALPATLLYATTAASGAALAAVRVYGRNWANAGRTANPLA